MLNRQSQIKTTAYYNCTEGKNQLKIANYITIDKKNSCPLDGKCLTKCVGYKATVTETTLNNKKRYIRLTENEFRMRFNLHKIIFQIKTQENFHNTKRTRLETKKQKHQLQHHMGGRQKSEAIRTK